MPYIDQFFEVLVTEGASDLHLGEGQPPKIRRHGDVMAIRDEPVTRDEAVHMMSEISGPKSWEIFEERGDLDFAYEMDEESRFRCNFLKQTNGYGGVFRLIPTKIASLEQLGMPPVVKEFGHLRGGLVLVTGPTGSGKSTTLAALIDYINSNYSRHIITIEEPIEFVHNNKQSIITQREVPEHSATFPAGLKAALREDADIVLVGEMRDLETISARADRGGDRPARLRHPAHEQRPQDGRPYDRRLPRRQAAAGPHDARQLAARRGRAAPPEARRRQGPARG